MSKRQIKRMASGNRAIPKAKCVQEIVRSANQRSKYSPKAAQTTIRGGKKLPKEQTREGTITTGKRLRDKLCYL